MKSFIKILKLVCSPLLLLKRKYNRSKRKNTLHQLAHQPIKKIIVGSSGTSFEGWTSSDQDVLNLLDERDWRAFFEHNSLDAILAEHVWEHLTPDEAIIAAAHCFQYLKPGGHVRAAVPDGYQPNLNYIERVKPGGKGPGSDDHKVLYTFNTFSSIFTQAGFEVSLYEYFDERGKFHCQEWSPVDGMIKRSKRFDGRNSDGKLNYTSIILDAKKPASLRP